MDPAWKEKASQICLVLTDCDGVLTDGGVYYSDQGEALKRFHMRDGMGVKRLRLAGIETGIVTGEMSPSVLKRAERLQITEVHLGARDKLVVVTQLLKLRNLKWENLAYIGDDVNDLPVLRRVGISACPADAVDAVRGSVQMVLRTPGGQGVFREFAEQILAGTSLSVEAHD